MTSNAAAATKNTHRLAERKSPGMLGGAVVKKKQRKIVSVLTKAVQATAGAACALELTS